MEKPGQESRTEDEGRAKIDYMWVCSGIFLLNE
jgi:hypothetical protein